MIQLASLNLTASDVTGQRQVAAHNVPANHTVGELLNGLLPRMQLDRMDRSGQRVHFDARLDREARHLHRSELVGDALQPDDHLVLHPRIMAG